jgi:uncharacterized cupin superfamily protein
VSELEPFAPIDALRVPVTLEDVPSAQVTAGLPRTGLTTVAALAGAQISIWEMTAGGMRDIEIDEVFIVLAGEATVTLFVDEVETDRIELRPGVICRLEAGATTRWDVARVLRKVYISEQKEPAA